jgi:hypothetical protein
LADPADDRLPGYGQTVPTRAPPPRFHVGNVVRVCVNERTLTPWVGVVRRIVWHHRQARWMFYLRVGERKISKRYWSDDLEWSEAPAATATPPRPVPPDGRDT